MSSSALSLVREAIELDNKTQNLPALIKYTEAVVAIGGALLETYKSTKAETGYSSDSSAKKFLAVLNQCVDRINGLFDLNGEDKKEVCQRLTPAAAKIKRPISYGMAVSNQDIDPIESISDDFCERSSLTDGPSFRSSYGGEDPVSGAIEQNRRLVAAHVEKIKRGQMTPSAEATMNMTLQRQMTENLELARQRKRELDTKREQTRRTALEALEKNRDTASLSTEEKEFLADVKTFEEDCADLRLYALELNKYGKKQANSSEFQIVIEHYMDAILSIPDHPFCNRMRHVRHARIHHLNQVESDARRLAAIRTMIEDDLRALEPYFLHSLLIKRELKPKLSGVLDRLNETYISGLMPSLADFYRETFADEIKILKEKLRSDQVKRFLGTPSPPAAIKDAAKTLRSFNDALTPKALLNILVSTCKAVSCRESETGGEHEKLNTDDLLCTLAAVVVEARSSDIIVWAAIMEEFIGSIGEGQSAIGEEGFCLTSLHAAIQFVMSE